MYKRHICPCTVVSACPPELPQVPFSSDIYKSPLSLFFHFHSLAFPVSLHTSIQVKKTSMPQCPSAPQHAQDAGKAAASRPPDKGAICVADGPGNSVWAPLRLCFRCIPAVLRTCWPGREVDPQGVRVLDSCRSLMCTMEIRGDQSKWHVL